MLQAKLAAAAAATAAVSEAWLPAEVSGGDLQAYLAENGYAAAGPPPAAQARAGQTELLHELIAELAAQSLPPVFAYLYDPTWALLLEVWPTVEAILGGECVMEPSFAAFRLSYQKAAANRQVAQPDVAPNIVCIVSSRCSEWRSLVTNLHRCSAGATSGTTLPSLTVTTPSLTP